MLVFVLAPVLTSLMKTRLKSSGGSKCHPCDLKVLLIIIEALHTFNFSIKATQLLLCPSFISRGWGWEMATSLRSSQHKNYNNRKRFKIRSKPKVQRYCNLILKLNKFKVK